MLWLFFLLQPDFEGLLRTDNKMDSFHLVLFMMLITPVFVSSMTILALMVEALLLKVMKLTTFIIKQLPLLQVIIRTGLVSIFCFVLDPLVYFSSYSR